MNINQPIFTIITPAYNQGNFIRETIQSVLYQNIKDLEYLIFDAGSTDETIHILESFGNNIRWISEPDRGQAHAVNKGLETAKGKIIGWLNSDDIYYPAALRSVLETFENNSEIEILYGMADHINEYSNVIEPYYTEEWNYDQLKNVCYICQPAVFFRRSVFEKFGILDERLLYCMDYEYWLRIGRKIPFYYLKQKLAGSRLHKDNKTLKSSVDVHEEILKMFKDKLGIIPSKWIYNYAHVVVNNSGLKRECPDDNFNYIKKMILVVIKTSLKYRYYLTISELREIAGWYISAAIRAKMVKGKNENRF